MCNKIQQQSVLSSRVLHGDTRHIPSQLQKQTE